MKATYQLISKSPFANLREAITNVIDYNYVTQFGNVFGFLQDQSTLHITDSELVYTTVSQEDGSLLVYSMDVAHFASATVASYGITIYSSQAGESICITSQLFDVHKS